MSNVDIGYRVGSGNDEIATKGVTGTVAKVCHCKNGSVAITIILCGCISFISGILVIIIHGNQSSSLWRGVHAFTISSHVL